MAVTSIGVAIRWSKKACWEVCEYFMSNRNTIKIDSPNEIYIEFGS